MTKVVKILNDTFGRRVEVPEQKKEPDCYEKNRICPVRRRPSADGHRGSAGAGLMAKTATHLSNSHWTGIVTCGLDLVAEVTASEAAPTGCQWVSGPAALATDTGTCGQPSVRDAADSCGGSEDVVVFVVVVGVVNDLDVSFVGGCQSLVTQYADNVRSCVEAKEKEKRRQSFVFVLRSLSVPPLFQAPATLWSTCTSGV